MPKKWTFDWVIAPSKYGCVVEEWILGFSKKYLKFHFGQSPQVVLGLVKIWGHSAPGTSYTINRVHKDKRLSPRGTPLDKIPLKMKMLNQKLDSSKTDSLGECALIIKERNKTEIFKAERW